MHIALAFDLNYLTPFYVVLTSIFHNKKGDYKIIFHVIATGLDENAKDSIIKFVVDNNSEIIFYDLDPSYNVDDLVIPEGGKVFFSKATYYRLYLPLVIPNCVKKLIFIDVDTVVLTDLSSLYEMSLNLFPVAAVVDNAVDSFGLDWGFLQKLGFFEKGKYFNAGVLLLNLDLWREQKISERALQFLIEFPHLITFVDQDALNYVLKDNWLKLESSYNVTLFDVKRIIPKDVIAKNSKIIHFTTGNKPWLILCTNKMRYLYFFYLSISPQRKMLPYKLKSTDFITLLKYYKIKTVEYSYEDTFISGCLRRVMSIFKK